jgi:hypothetical protein
LCCAKEDIGICILLLPSKEYWGNFISQKLHHERNMGNRMNGRKGMEVIKEKEELELRMKI